MNKSAEAVFLDLRGLKCPLPVLKTRAALRAMAPGDVLVVETTDPMSVIDIPHFLAQSGDVLIRQSPSSSSTRFEIRKVGMELAQKS